MRLIYELNAEVGDRHEHAARGRAQLRRNSGAILVAGPMAAELRFACGSLAGVGL